MQWGHIKTLFILSFLILNIYLLVQFIDKQNNDDYGMLSDQDASIEERLAAENITIEPNLDMEITEETYILASQKKFNEVEVERLTKREDQNINVLKNNFIISRLKEPVPISEDASSEEVSNLVKSEVSFPEEFVYWGWNKELNILVFFQQIDGRPVYFNEHGPGLLMVYLNDNNEMEYYTQTMLGESESQGSGSRQLKQPIQAIELLFDRNILVPNEEVTDINIGYYSRFIEEGEQVFAPTWNITINGERSYFVNAIEGFVFSSDMSFIDSIATETISRIRLLDDEDGEIFKPLLDDLTTLIQQTENRSEDE
ncbi:two-component system regulatory protein YycI [Oceanobacillus halophilus]|uniref:Regulatory protein YycH-like domain-containing protein n=1 Tax=Oceanobacillus halophilus TaxID=930130 RepID=A0A495A0H8_9BACI|nr:two-component system regulatory protein YycI [Oceanobacillus halophilus]RKQ32943.1 hypothetical protein D8M06_11120 [Oceanobacillus halophilus]